MTQKHTPTPYKAHYGWSFENRKEPDPQYPNWVEITGGSHETNDFCSLSGHIGMATAAHIVKCVNLHDELVAYIEKDRSYWHAEKTAMETLSRAHQDRGEIGRVKECNSRALHAHFRIEAAEAAIAKARGEA